LKGDIAMIEIKNKEEFYEKVIDSRGKVLVEFYGDRCPKCRNLEFMLSKSSIECPIYKVNIDENMELANEYDVLSIPFLILFEDGKEVARQKQSPMAFIRNVV